MRIGTADRWVELAGALIAFAALAALVELTPLARELLLPAWTGVTLALAARHAHTAG